MKLIIFPLERRVGHVRHVAYLYSRKGKKAAESYWRVTWNRMANQLADLGVPPADAQAELEHFTQAVSAELVRLNYFSNSNRPDGAA